MKGEATGEGGGMRLFYRAAPQGCSPVQGGKRNRPWPAPPHIVSGNYPEEKQYCTYNFKSSAHFNETAAFSAT